MADSYKTRSEYFEHIAYMNKLIAHKRPIAEGSGKLRKAFFRMNDEDELNAACINWSHFPCVVHLGHDMRFRGKGTGLPNKIIGSSLLFLFPADGKDLAAGIQNAYDKSEAAMNKFISFMRNEMEEMDSCGNNIFYLDDNKIQAQEAGPYDNKLYGWNLLIEDEQLAKELKYSDDDWFEDMI